MLIYKPKKLGQLESVHGILRCQSVKHKSEIYHNRDGQIQQVEFSAVQNMLNIVKSIFDTGLRPELFCRSIL